MFIMDRLQRCLFKDGVESDFVSYWKESLFVRLTSFPPHLYLYQVVLWTSEEWKWWCKASRQETWMLPAIDFHQIMSIYLCTWRNGWLKKTPLPSVSWTEFSAVCMSASLTKTVFSDPVTTMRTDIISSIVLSPILSVKDWSEIILCRVKSKETWMLVHNSLIKMATNMRNNVVCYPKDGSAVTSPSISLAPTILFVHKLFSHV